MPSPCMSFMFACFILICNPSPTRRRFHFTSTAHPTIFILYYLCASSLFRSLLARKHKKKRMKTKRGGKKNRSLAARVQISFFSISFFFPSHFITRRGVRMSRHESFYCMRSLGKEKSLSAPKEKVFSHLISRRISSR
jgi:hypothetical protein